tara:strand:+ start:701 stop:1318 length:618 start_codon:yes stop_codon:yes gene_type:complete
MSAYWMAMNRRHQHQVESWNVSRNASIGYRSIVRAGVEIYGDVVLGDYSYVSGPNSYVEAARIGKFCSIARQVIIGPGNHNLVAVTTHPFRLSPSYGGLITVAQHESQRPPPVIGNDVWIGINCVILRGAMIGDGAVVAANSVVTGEVPPYAIFGGNPARLIRFRFDMDTVSKMQRIRWWDWSEKKLRDCVADFNDPVKFLRRHG